MRAWTLVAFLASCVVYDKSLVSGDAGPTTDAGPCGAKTMCVKTCVDTQTDPKNCGMCGRDCKDATCKNGSCQGIVLASALPAPRGIAIDATRVYFSNHGSISTQMVNKDGTGLVGFGGPQVFPDVLVLEGTSLYWNNETNLKGAILSIDTTILPNDMPLKVSVDLPAPTGVAVVNNDVFFTTGPMNGAPGCSMSTYVNALMRCPITGCIPASCGGGGGPNPIASGLVDPHGLIADVASLYWVDRTTGNVFTCPTPNCMGGPKAIASMQGGPRDLVMDAQNLYWTNGTAGEIGTCSRADCTDAHVLATGQMSPRRLALENASPPTVIWWTSGDGTVKRCLLPDCPGGPTTIAQGVAGPWGIAVDNGYAYVVAEGSQGTTSVDGAILKFPR